MTINKDPESETVRIRNTSVISLSDEILSINDGGNGGFPFQAVRIDGEAQSGAYAVDPATLGSASNERVSTFGDTCSKFLSSRAE